MMPRAKWNDWVLDRAPTWEEGKEGAHHSEKEDTTFLNPFPLLAVVRIGNSGRGLNVRSTKKAEERTVAWLPFYTGHLTRSSMTLSRSVAYALL